MTLLKNLLVAVAVGSISISAMAADTPQTAKAEHDIVLKDGSTLHVFKDGKMAMEDKYGRAVRMEEGAQMETKDGKKFIMNSDEVARLSSELRLKDKGGIGGHSTH